jgi:hypothetical protein
MRRRTSGSEGRGGGPVRGRRRRRPSFFFPRPRPEVLQEAEGDQVQQRVVMQRSPTAALQMIEPELIFHLLMRLLAAPPGFDVPRQRLQRGVRRVVAHVVLLLSRVSPLAHQPLHLLSRQPLALHLRPFGHAHPHRDEARLQRPLRALAPGDLCEGLLAQRLDVRLGTHARHRHPRVLARPSAPLGLGPEQLHIRRIDALLRSNIDLDYFWNRYDADSDKLGMRAAPGEHEEVMERVERFLAELSRAPWIPEIEAVSIAVSPGFFPTDHWSTVIPALRGGIRSLLEAHPVGARPPGR